MLEIELIEGCLVKASSPKTQADEFTPLTRFDTRYLFIPYLQMILFYPGCRSEAETLNLIRNARACLSELLVHFYPVAGCLVPRFPAHPTYNRVWGVRSTGLGVEWRLSKANIQLSQLDYTQPSSKFSSLVRKGAFESLASQLLCIQATMFTCGGVSLAFAWNHALMDLSSLFHLLLSWSEICLHGRISRPPYMNRDHPLLLPALCSDPIRKYKVARGYELSSRIFWFSREYIDRLKQEAPGYSSYVVLSAHIWINMSRARELPDSETTSNAVAASCKRRMVPQLPDDYFGNTVLHAVAETTVGELVERGLGYSAGLLRDAIRKLNSMDEIENKLANTRIAANGLGRNKNMLSTGSQWLAYENIDLGWGKPVAIRQVGLEKYGLDGLCMFLSSSRSPDDLFEVTISLPETVLGKLAEFLVALP